MILLRTPLRIGADKERHRVTTTRMMATCQTTVKAMAGWEVEMEVEGVEVEEEARAV